MIALLRRYFTTVLPALLRRRQYAAALTWGVMMLLGPSGAENSDQPWEQPYIYANF